MTISKLIVEAHGSQISVQSQVLGVERPSHIHAAPYSIIKGKCNRRRILIIDDEENMERVSRLTLRRFVVKSPSRTEHKVLVQIDEEAVG